jgi:hypothetical protein
MKSKADQFNKARLIQHNIELNRLNAHAVVVRMLKDNIASEEVINKAKEQLKKWRENNLCSNDYILDWEALLENPTKAAEVLSQMSPYSIRLRQNSPFSAFLK